LVPAHLGFLGDSWATRRAEFVVLAVAVAVAVAVVVAAAATAGNIRVLNIFQRAGRPDGF
jgi:hypothetical protein